MKEAFMMFDRELTGDEFETANKELRWFGLKVDDDIYESTFEDKLSGETTWSGFGYRLSGNSIGYWLLTKIFRLSEGIGEGGFRYLRTKG